MRFILRITTFLAFTLVAASLLSGCSGLRFPGVYRLNIQQGNIITQEMIDQLEPGMTRRQVDFVLGTPIIMDTFSDNRWDYLYTMKFGNGQSLRKILTVYFEDDKLAYFTGDYKKTEKTEQEEPVQDSFDNQDTFENTEADGENTETDSENEPAIDATQTVASE